MARHLPDHVHAAAIGEDLVLLDLGADAYLCVPGGAAGAARGFPDGDPATQALQPAGLLAAGPPPKRPLTPPLPLRGLPSHPPRLRPGDLVRLSAATADLLWGYAGRPLGSILRRLPRGGAELPEAELPEAELLRLAAVFARLAPWLPISGKCLVRSFVLLRFVQRSGGRAAWVFGVRTWPFGAHCWLQLGDVVLDDDPSRLSVYAPILAVGG